MDESVRRPMCDFLSLWESIHGEVPYDKAIVGRLLTNHEPLDCQTCEGEIFHRVGCPTAVLELREMEKYDAYWEAQRRRFPRGFFETETDDPTRTSLMANREEE